MSMNGYQTSCLIHGAKQIVQIVSNKARYVRGVENMKSVAVLEENSDKGDLMLVSIGGIIRFVGYENDPQFEKYRDFNFSKKINAKNCCILPGFVDSHTHPVWAGDRVHEFQMKLAGATYMEIHQAGGGIHFTVEHTKRASEELLYESLMKRLRTAIRTGTTFIECKTGYGLEWETEYKMLKVLTKANRNTLNIKPGLSITYLAAHAVPKNKTADEATDDIIENQIPRLQILMKSREIDVHNIDVFCEKGVFDVEQSKAILEAGRSIGLQINFHGDELNPLNSVEMGVNLGSRAISHLEEISDEEISLMSKSETVGILLPTTAYILRLKQPPARKMIDNGCIVALGSDYNPNAFCYSMPIVMHLACINMKMSLTEALIASTINSAFALGVESTRGSIEVGKYADILILQADRWEHIIYQIACHDTVIKFVLINGEIVHSTL